MHFHLPFSFSRMRKWSMLGGNNDWSMSIVRSNILKSNSEWCDGCGSGSGGGGGGGNIDSFCCGLITEKGWIGSLKKTDELGNDEVVVIGAQP